MFEYCIYAFITYIIFTIVYVYKIRGQERFKNFTEYLSKGWIIFAPINCLLYIFTKSHARKAIVDTVHFKDLKILQDNWQAIAQEANALFHNNIFDSVKNKKSASYYDVGFRTFYKHGWSKFYLKWYGGYYHKSAQEMCPVTLNILKQCKSVNGAMFSVLPPQGKLSRHLDPFATSLRYHLGLNTPNDNQAFINIDGNTLSWRDGQAFMFDETYLHYAQNNTSKNRIILMCDIERPMNFFGTLFNTLFYKNFLRFSIVPNMVGDKRGLANRVFASVVPVLNAGKRLKQSNIIVYKLLKYSINLSILCAIVALFIGLPYLFVVFIF